MNNYKNPAIEDYCCLDSLCNAVLDSLLESEDRNVLVDIIANKDITQEVIRWFLAYDTDFGEPFSLGMVEYNPVDYDREYVVSINSDYEVWCEPAWRDNEYGTGYITIGADVMYVYEDCSYKILDKAQCSNIKIFGFGE